MHVPGFVFTWIISKDVGFKQQGVDAKSGSHPPRKTLPFCGDIKKGRFLDVPAHDQTVDPSVL